MKLITRSAVILLAIIATASGDYLFPSSAIPGGKTAAEVDQYVSFIWDDNGYSGLNGTQYEPVPYWEGTLIDPTTGDTSLAYSDNGFVGGYVRDWASTPFKLKPGGNDPLSIAEGDMGLAWALHTLSGFSVPAAIATWNSASTYSQNDIVEYNGNTWMASHWMAAGIVPDGVVPTETWTPYWIDQGAVPEMTSTRLNPDGSPVSMTFNMISGLYVPAWGPDWKSRESEYGSFVPTTPGAPHLNIAVAWGREAMYGTTTVPDRDGTDFMVQMVQRMSEAGMEIGNHTIDHIETNSPWPLSLWPNGGDGFDDGTSGTDALGNPWSEVDEFGGDPLSYAQTHGWKYYAGKALGVATWEGIIALGEQDGPKNGINDKLYGFRAPRLEVNSAMFFALKNKGYLYDCGNEEGYESNRDGTNFVWPYTTDNGTQNAWTQTEFGEHVYIDSMPAGLWQYPVNVMIVPESYRAGAFASASEIAAAEGEDIGELADWDGKITGFDFNMFILWGMTGPAVEATLKNTLDLRMAGNKAPMHIGCHTDYFTPIYDNATLLSKTNKDVYGLAMKYNTWVDRKAAFEAFTTYALAQGAYIKSAKETIEYVRSLGNGDVATNIASGPTSWVFDGDDVSSSTPTGTISNLENVSVSIGLADTVADLYPAPSFNGVVSVSNVSHMSLDYQTEVPLKLAVTFASGAVREALLNNIGRQTFSGQIPMGALEANPYDENPGVVGQSSITAVSVLPLSNGLVAKDVNFSITNLKFYTSDSTIVPVSGSALGVTQNLAIRGLSTSALNLEIPASGVYTVNIISASGRIVKSFNKMNLSQGVNALKLSSLSQGVYMINVIGHQSNLQKTMKTVLR